MSSLRPMTMRYSNGEVTIVWKHHLCIHAGNCARGLASVFKPREKPWIDPQGASAEAIVAQVAQCPSGALSIEYPEKPNTTDMENNNLTRVTVTDKGPYLVKGTFVFVDKDGKEETKEGNIALCRCGLSKNKPFCDGAHRSSDVLSK